MRRIRAVVALSAAALLLLAACGDDNDEPSTAGATTTAAAATNATVQLGDTSLGKVLVDADGMTLYVFAKDTDGKSSCTGACAEKWPALTATGEPTAGKGIDEDDLGTTARDDGKTQVTYYDKPLYHFSGDSAAGDTKGQGVGGVWSAVKADGEPVASSTSTTAAATSGGDASAITIQGFAFAPATLHVAVGATVTTTNRDSATHTWTADDGSFSSGNLDQGKSATHTFTKAGTFAYHCEIHPSMKGTVVVA